MDVWQNIVAFVEESRGNPAYYPPALRAEAEALHRQVMGCWAYALLVHQEGDLEPRFDDQVRVLLKGEGEVDALGLQRQVALGQVQAGDIEAPPPFIACYVDLAERLAIAPLGNGTALALRLPALIFWTMERALAAEAGWDHIAGQDLRQAIHRHPRTGPLLEQLVRRGEDATALVQSAWGLSQLEARRDRSGIPRRFLVVEGQPLPALGPEAHVLERVRGLLRQELGRGIHSARSKRQIAPLHEEGQEEGHPQPSAPALAVQEEDVVLLKVDLQEALATLSEEMRAIVRLALVEGLSQQEVARRLRLSQPTVSRRLQEALRLLRQRLSR